MLREGAGLIAPTHDFPLACKAASADLGDGVVGARQHVLDVRQVEPQFVELDGHLVSGGCRP
jgi:hypothetical protein